MFQAITPGFMLVMFPVGIKIKNPMEKIHRIFCVFLSIDKIPKVWYNWRRAHGRGAPNFALAR